MRTLQFRPVLSRLPRTYSQASRYVLTAHLGDVPGGVPEQTDHLFRLLGPFVTPVWRRARCVTAVSRFVAGLARKAYGLTPIVIPNGVRPIARPQLRAHSPRRIVMAGRLSIQKNPLLAIKALGFDQGNGLVV